MQAIEAICPEVNAATGTVTITGPEAGVLLEAAKKSGGLTVEGDRRSE